jgi:3-hydroxy acid dehydrogenase/malonic semialdehyde reductase
MTRIKGKLALVTGASAGIGEACARQLAEDGANLLLVARREERLAELRSVIESEHGVSVAIGKLDVRDRAAVNEHVGKLAAAGTVPDILINNAGLARGLARLQEGDPNDWDEMIDTNVKGLLNMSRAVLPLMVARDSGHVINIGSTAGHAVYPMGNVYNATKFAVRALNEGMNLDLVGTNVRVASIDPGATDTEFSEVRFHGDKERAKGVYKGFKPLEARDIAEVVSFVLNRPPHVNIQDVLMLCTAQRSPYVLHREE